MVGVRFAIPSKFAHSEHADKRFVRCQRDDFRCGFKAEYGMEICKEKRK